MRADQVPSSPESATTSSARRRGTPARDPGGGEYVEHAPPIVEDVLGSPGEPLDPGVRSLVERRLDFTFGSVRVHRDGQAAESAAAVGAHAYTVGNHIVFGSGRYEPGTPGGRWLIAHELSHVRQQRDVPVDPGQLARRLEIGRSDALAERAADNMADAVTQGHPLRHDLVPVRVPTVQRFGAGDSFLRFFGIESGTFSSDELLGYLTEIVKKRKPFGGHLGDDLARAVVDRGGVGGKGGYKLTDESFQGIIPSTDIKRILIQEMLSGPTDSADEDAIVKLFQGSSGPQIREILDPQLGLSIQDVEADLDDDDIALLYQTIDAKLPDVLKTNLTRGKGVATTDGSCTAGRTMQIDFAHRRAIVQVQRVTRLLDQLTSKPAENKNVQRVLDTYFGGAKAADIATIRQNFAEIGSTIPRLTYACPAEPFTEFTVTDSKGNVTTFTAEDDVDGLALTQNTGNELKVLLFPGFFGSEPQSQARLVVHEAFHHAKRQPTIEEFYGSNCEGLALQTALTNADSYAQTARALAQDGLQVTIENCPPHVQAMVLTATRKAEIDTARAVSGLAGTVSDRTVLRELRRHFKVDPAAPEDQGALATIRDVFAKIQAGFGSTIEFVCEEAGEDDDRSAQAAKTGGIFFPTGGTIHLFPAWAAAEPDDRAHIILHEMGHRAAGLGFGNDIYRKLDLARYNKSTTEESVSNADAYASFARSLASAERAKEEEKAAAAKRAKERAEKAKNEAPTAE